MIRTIASAVAAVTLVGSALAAPGDLGVAQDFNALIFGNLTANAGDTEGRLGVGGDFSASSYSVGFGTVGSSLPNSGGTRDDLIVGGNMNAAGGWQVFYGNAVYGSLTAAPTTPNGSTYMAPAQYNPVDFGAAYTDLNAKSAAWGALTPNATSVVSFSTLNLTGTDPLLNIFNVAASDWGSTTDKQINIPAGSTALINIQGTTVTHMGGMSLNGSNNIHSPATQADMAGVLFNFYEADTVNHNYMALLGSVLAPNANWVGLGGSVNGTAVLGSASQNNGFEFHNIGFTGNVPTPGTAALLGLAGLATAARRRR